MFIAVYIDDLLILGLDIDLFTDNLMQNLQDKFQITDFNKVPYYVRMKININLGKKKIIF